MPVSIGRFYEKAVTELQYSQVSVLQDKEAFNFWYFMLNFKYGQLYLVKMIVEMPQSLEHFVVDLCMCLSIIPIILCWMATAIFNLIAIRRVWKQLQSFSNNTGVGILVSFTTSNDNELQKIVKTIQKAVLNKAKQFCANESQLQVE